MVRSELERLLPIKPYAPPDDTSDYYSDLDNVQDIQDEESLLASVHLSDISPLSAHPRPKLTRLQTIVGYLCFLMIGTAPQLFQNAVFSQTGIFSVVLPIAAGPSVVASVVTCFLVAQIVMLGYLVVNAFKPVPLYPSMGVMFAVLFVAGTIGAVLWDRVVQVFVYPVPIFVLLTAFLCASVGNTSTLVFFRWCALFHSPAFTSALSTGYGLSGVIVTLCLLAQGAWQPMALNFTVGVFFCFCMIWTFLCLGVLLWLIKSEFGKGLRLRCILVHRAKVLAKEREGNEKFRKFRNNDMCKKSNFFARWEKEKEQSETDDETTGLVQAPDVRFTFGEWDDDDFAMDDDSKTETSPIMPITPEKTKVEMGQNAKHKGNQKKSKKIPFPDLVGEAHPRKKTLFWRSLWLQVAMLWVSFLTFSLPATIPLLEPQAGYADGTRLITTSMNGVFLCLPPIGSLVAGILPSRTKSKSVLVVLQLLHTSLFVWYVAPLCRPFQTHFPLQLQHTWQLWMIMTMYCFLCGYIATSVFMAAHKLFSEDKEKERVSEWLAANQQLGMVGGVLFADVLLGVGFLVRTLR